MGTKGQASAPSCCGERVCTTGNRNHKEESVLSMSQLSPPFLHHPVGGGEGVHVCRCAWHFWAFHTFPIVP